MGRYIARVSAPGRWMMVAGLLAAMVPGAAVSQDEEFDDFAEFDLESLLNTEVVSASQSAESLSDAPAVIEVITREQIKRWNIHTLDEALGYIAGIDIVENYLGYTNINMRGIVQSTYNNRVLLLIDGLPLFEAANGSFHTEQIPISSIERIEVIRGPGAILYGTNAFAGVISIVTRKPEDSGGDARAWIGAPLAGGVDASGGHRWEDGYVQMFAQYYHSQQWTGRVPADENGIGGTFPRANTFVTLSGRFEQAMGTHGTLSLQGGFMTQEKTKWSFLPDFNFQSQPNDVNGAFVEAGYAWQPENWSIASSVAFLRYDRELHLGVVSQLSPEQQTIFITVNSIRTSLTGTWRKNKWTLRTGAQYLLHQPNRYEALLHESRTLSPLQGSTVEKDTTINDLNAYAQVRWDVLERLSLATGLRYNLFQAKNPLPGGAKPSDKHTVNPQASVVARLSEKTTGKLLYGRAFRLPTLWELYTDAPLIITGNPDLRPEIIDTVELAFDVRPIQELSIRVDGFMNFTRDLVARDVDALGAARYVNRPGEWIRGVELSLRWLPIPALDILVTGGFQEGFAKQGDHFDQYLDDIHRVSGVGSLTWKAIENWLELTPQMQYIGKRAGFSDAVLLHAHARSSWKNYSLSVAGKNLTDRRYAVPEQQRRIMRDGIIANQPLQVEFILAAEF